MEEKKVVKGLFVLIRILLSDCSDEVLGLKQTKTLTRRSYLDREHEPIKHADVDTKQSRTKFYKNPPKNLAIHISIARTTTCTQH